MNCQASPDPFLFHVLKTNKPFDNGCLNDLFSTLVRAEGGRRYGFMGHLTRIANCVVHSTDKGPNSTLVQQLMKGNSFFSNDICT